MFGLGRRRNRERIEPRFESSPRERSADLRADPEDRPSRRGGGARRGARRKRGREKRSAFGRLVYWCFVLGVWAVIGVGGLFAYHASQLPPIDQLAVPKRPPNIAILAEDGTLLANRGDTGGAAVPLSEL